MRLFQRIEGKIVLVSQLIRSNIRFAVVSLIGLTIALSMIAASTFYLETNKSLHYSELLKDPILQQQKLDHWIFDHDSSYTHEEILKKQEIVNSKISELDLDEILQPISYSPFCNLITTMYYLSQNQSGRLIGINFNESILNYCVEGSSLPTTINDVIIFSPDDNGITLGQDFNISFMYNSSSNYTFELTVKGIITPETLKNSSYLLENIIPLISYSLFTTIDKYFTLIDKINTDLYEISPINEYFGSMIIFRNKMDISTVQKDNVVSTIHRIHRYLKDLSKQNIPTLGNIFEFLNSKINEYNNFFLLFMILSTPSFIVTYMLIRFSLDSINESRKNSFSLLKMRSFSSSFIFVILITEMIIISLLASILGFFFGMVLSILIITTTGFLSFDVNRIPEMIVITLDNLLLTIILGIFLSTVSNFKTIFKLAKSKGIDLELEASKSISKKSTSIRNNIDIFLLIQGFLSIVILNWFREVIFEIAYNESTEILTVFLPIIVILGFLSTLIFLIGFIFTFNRLIPKMISFSDIVFQKFDWRLLIITTRNLISKRNLVKHTTLLITCTTSFLVILSILPNSIYQNNVNNAIYDIGSDIRVTGDLKDDNQIIFNSVMLKINNVSGLDATCVSRFEYSFDIHDSSQISYRILGIESNFDKVAYWKSSYADSSLSTLVSSIYNSTANYPAIIDTYSANMENLKIGDQLRISPKAEKHQNGLSDINVTIEEITEFWPVLIKRSDKNERFIITKHSKMKNITATIHGNNYNPTKEIWCNINDRSNENSTIETIEQILIEFGINDFKIQSTRKETEMNPDSISDIILWIISNFNFIASLFVILTTIIIYTSTGLSNQSSEIALSRALGMKHYQILTILFFEPFLLFLISGIPGGIFGILLLFSFENIISTLTSNSKPPFVLILDISSIMLIFAFILLIIMISGMITSYISIRANISKVLKVEE